MDQNRLCKSHIQIDLVTYRVANGLRADHQFQIAVQIVQPVHADRVVSSKPMSWIKPKNTEIFCELAGLVIGSIADTQLVITDSAVDLRARKVCSLDQKFVIPFEKIDVKKLPVAGLT